jgi:hypothetical protein
LQGQPDYFACTERLRLLTRIRVLERDYASGSALLENGWNREYKPSLVRRHQEIGRALVEVRASYESHVAEHGCDPA